MDITSLILELFTNADHFLMVLATEYGWFVYLAMFLIFFLETGIVGLAFLPGDSLLFVSGTVAAAGTMSPWGLMLAVILGACLGNTLGFHTGRWLGNKIYDGSISWIDIEKLRKTQIFYGKARWQDDRSCSFRADRTSLCPVGGRCRPHEHGPL